MSVMHVQLNGVLNLRERMAGLLDGATAQAGEAERAGKEAAVLRKALDLVAEINTRAFALAASLDVDTLGAAAALLRPER